MTGTNAGYWGCKAVWLAQQAGAWSVPDPSPASGVAVVTVVLGALLGAFLGLLLSLFVNHLLRFIALFVGRRLGGPSWTIICVLLGAIVLAWLAARNTHS